jgi:flavin-binding protein dodecin
MTIAKITEIYSDSAVSFQDAIEAGIAHAEKKLRNVKGAWVAEQKLIVEKGKILSDRVIMRVSFVLE